MLLPKLLFISSGRSCQMADAAGREGPPTVYFGDMGYASYNNFAHVIENGQYFLIRCNDKRAQRILGHPLDGIKELDCHVDRILSRSRPSIQKSMNILCRKYGQGQSCIIFVRK